MKLVCWCLLIFHYSTCLGQVIDDFSDGNFTTSPKWTGDSLSFIIKSEQLQLNETSAGISYLSTISQSINQASWEFDVELRFNPSAQNFCRVYLTSDSPILTSELKGYYLQVGNKQDQINLFRQDLNKHHVVIAGPEGITNTSNPKVSIRVTRDSLGLWALYVKNPALGGFELFEKTIDSTYTSSHFFGFVCRYTTTRSTGFVFDNVKVAGSFNEDIMPPKVLSLQALNRHILKLVVNEPILNPKVAQFSVHGLGKPDHIVSSGYNSWEVGFSGSLVHGESYVLDLELLDFSENQATLVVPFKFWEIGTPNPHDVIFTEIMADPLPVLQLPDEEYLEIYNTSDSSLNLKDWKLSDASISVTLPDYLIDPGSYVVLCRINKRASFPTVPNILPLTRWPSLNNMEDFIVLSDTTGSIIHQVHYDNGWYRNNLKKHGGWSMEMIDVNYPCSGAPNWAASESPTGGTPGKVNSITTDNPDLSPPEIISTLALDAMLFNIRFDQALGHIGHSSLSMAPFLAIDSFFINNSARTEIIVRLADPMAPGVVYKVLLSGVPDCNGNIDHNKGVMALIGLPQKPDSGDLVINEVLFNPRPLGVRFVEIYNLSNKVIDLKNWRLARWQSENLTNFITLSDDHIMVYPDEIKVFSKEIHTLTGHYPNIPAEASIEVNELPSLPDREGSLVIISDNGLIIDDFRYHEKMHHPLLKSREGVSLERASPNLLTNDPNNWHSGAEATGYASPGVVNSQFFKDFTSAEFKVEPRLISPRSSQLPVYARIFFQLQKPGSTGSVYIFNQHGIRVKTLVNNSLLSTNGTFQWDGTNLDGLPVPMGYYVILFQFTLSDGTVGRFMETVAVASGF